MNAITRLAALVSASASAAVLAGWSGSDTSPSGAGAAAPQLATLAGGDGGIAGDSPDVIVGSMNGVMRWTGDGTKTAYSFGTTSCNIGNDPLEWIDEGTSTLYPVIGQNMFRLSPDGRFEQIGMGWLKHAFCALQGTLCGSCAPYCGGCCNHLGVGCSDPYGASLNGDQPGLGPKWDVNAHTGEHSNIDFMSLPPIQNGFSRRVVVQNTDLDSGQNPGALYFIEGQYVTRDDSIAGNQNNNASYKRVTVGAAPNYNLTPTGATLQEEPAIRAWKTHDPFANDGDPGNNVVLKDVQVPNDGLFIVGHQVTEVVPGALWHYEFAVYNMNSHRSARTFTVPVGENVTISNVGFHDVDYHSGELFSPTNWTHQVSSGSGGAVTWATSTFAENPNANALRWGTVYNFRFDADSPPETVFAELGLFRPGAVGDPDIMTVTALGPAPLEPPSCAGDTNDDGVVDVTDLVNVITGWNGADPAADVNDDGIVDVQDLVIVTTEWGPC
jgi:hypothetical protein